MTEHTDLLTMTRDELEAELRRLSAAVPMAPAEMIGLSDSHWQLVTVSLFAEMLTVRNEARTALRILAIQAGQDADNMEEYMEVDVDQAAEGFAEDVQQAKLLGIITYMREMQKRSLVIAGQTTIPIPGQEG